MLNIFSGGIRSKKRDMLLDKLNIDIKNGEEIIFFIPDQISFEYDKKLYSVLGAKNFNKIEVISFKRFSENLIKLYGSKEGTFATDNERLLVLNSALKKVRGAKNVEYFKKTIIKPSFINTLSELIKDLRKAHVTPESLDVVAFKANGNLQNKISEISSIYSAYIDTLAEKKLKDDNTIISEGAKIASEQGYFKGKTVYFDEFNSFTADEIEVLKCAINQSNSLNCAMTCPTSEIYSNIPSVFSTTADTISLLKSLYNGKLSDIKTFDADSSDSYNAESLRLLSKNLFSNNSIDLKSDNNISVVSAGDLYMEIEYVASKIHHLIIENGYKYSDFLVVTRRIDTYSSVIESTFENYEIPYFLDFNQSVSQKALFLYILSILDIASSKKYNSEKIFRCIKSTLSNMDMWETSALEEYCQKWNVDGDMWLNDFTASENSGKLNPLLPVINKIRERLITKFENFKSKTKNASGKEICKAFYELLNALEITDKTYATINNSSDTDDKAAYIRIIRDFKQMWNSFSSSLNTIYELVGDEKISLKEFSDMLKLMINNTKISNPPQTLDSVMIASAERSRMLNPKIVFVVGLNEGLFPMDIKNQGLFTEQDYQILSENGVEISRSLIKRVYDERIMAYQTICSASDRLTLSYPKVDLNGKYLRKSSLIKRTLDIFGDSILINCETLPIEFFCTTLNSTYHKFVEHQRDKSESLESLKSLLKLYPEYNEKIEHLKSIEKNSTKSLSKSVSNKMFFERDLTVSSSKLEKYMNCPYNFFFDYGIGLKPPLPVELNPINKGNILHGFMEEILSENLNGDIVFNESFLEYNESDIRSYANDYINRYKAEKLGGDFGKTERFNTLLQKMCDVLVEACVNLQGEFMNSKFRPSEFEKSFDVNYSVDINEDGDKSLSLDINGLTVKFTGKIDRIDTYVDDEGRKYIKIVDYKSKEKDFDLEKIYNGLNLQMILYMNSIK